MCIVICIVSLKINDIEPMLFDYMMVKSILSFAAVVCSRHNKKTES